MVVATAWSGLATWRILSPDGLQKGARVMVGDNAEQAAVRRERAEYIERMSLELGRMATAAGLPLLAFLLDMAAQEAAESKGEEGLRLKSDAGSGRQPRAWLNGG